MVRFIQGRFVVVFLGADPAEKPKPAAPERPSAAAIEQEEQVRAKRRLEKAKRDAEAAERLVTALSENVSVGTNANSRLRRRQKPVTEEQIFGAQRAVERAHTKLRKAVLRGDHWGQSIALRRYERLAAILAALKQRPLVNRTKNPQ
jgi:hypothetical protein